MTQALLRASLIVGALYLAALPSRAQSLSDATAGQAVMQVDEEFRLAKLHNDTATLDRILADSFYEMNQNGNGRNKSEFIDLFKGFSITSLTTDSFQIRSVGDTVSITGAQNENGDTPMLFLRVYVKSSNGWKLLSSMQTDNPKVTRVGRLRGLDYVRQIQDSKVQRSELLRTYSPSHPKVLVLNEQIKLLEQQLALSGR